MKPSQHSPIEPAFRDIAIGTRFRLPTSRYPDIEWIKCSSRMAFICGDTRRPDHHIPAAAPVVLVRRANPTD